MTEYEIAIEITHSEEVVFEPGACVIKCVCGRHYDSTNKVQRTEHYFHKREENNG